MWTVVALYICMAMFLHSKYIITGYTWRGFTVQDGSTPLLLAAERGHADLVKFLAGHYEGDIFHTTKVQMILLHGFQSHTHSHSNHTQSSIYVPLSSRTPKMRSTWQPTGVTCQSLSTSVPCSETECLTGTETMRVAWTLLAG